MTFLWLSYTISIILSDPDRFAVRCQDVSTETVSNHNIQMLMLRDPSVEEMVIGKMLLLMSSL